MKSIYFDYNATTPVDPEVLKAMQNYLECDFGNPASQSHSFGWAAEAGVNKAREQVATLIGALPSEIIFSSGATESNNLAILGVLKAAGLGPHHLITTRVEHKAVLNVCEEAERLGHSVTYLPVDNMGCVSAKDVEQAMQPSTRLVSVMMGNNEIGSLNPIRDIGRLCKERGVYFHTDAAQTAGKIPIDVDAMGIDLLSISAHKMYGPKGAGALYVRGKNPEVQISSIFFGGTQEKGLRPGTLNVPGIVGLGAACEICRVFMEDECARLSKWQERLIEGVLKASPYARLNGPRENRLCSNLSFSFESVSSDLLAMGLRGIALSSGSACTSSSASPSHVLKAIGHSDDLARATLRIGLGRFTTESDIEFALGRLTEICAKIK